MNIWLAVYLGMKLLGLGMHLAKHGEPRGDKYNFIYSFIGFGIDLLFLWGMGVL